jgi:hypothetical protein
MNRHLPFAGAVALALSLLPACGGSDSTPAGPSSPVTTTAGTPPPATTPPPTSPAPPPPTAPGAPPVILARNRNGCPPAGGLQVLLVGTGLVGDATVTFGGVPATGVQLDPGTQGLLVTAPAHADGLVDIVVTNPDGQSATSVGFHYGPPPTIASFAPQAAVRAGDLVTITGADFSFADALQVEVSATLATIVSATATEIVLSAPRMNPGSYPVIVVNFDGQYAVAPGLLTYPGP